MLDDTQRETVSQADGEAGTKEAEAFVDALNHSAERVQTLWFSFLTFMLYLAIATGTTTLRMLFLESPLILPVLNIALPLLGFYILAPVIFVVFHFYMLLNLVLLARTAKSFEDSLARVFPEDGEARETFRMRIENTLFVQLLVSGRPEREGFNARLLSLMSLITRALAPVALLLFLQIKFLPYHSEPITWLHRALLALDLVLVWTLWPGYRSGWGVRLWPQRSWWLALPGVLSLVALVYAFAVATFPDEHMYLATNWLHGESYWDFEAGRLSSRDRPNWYPWIAPVNALDLHGKDLFDDAKLKQITEKNESGLGENRWMASLSLAGRDLTGAQLAEADVRHVDFSGAILRRAILDAAWAKNTRFFEAQLQGASLNFAQLQGASLGLAKLQGASLNEAQLQGATLNGAQLQGGMLYKAQLQGGSLREAQLQGASLDGAQLQGASLREVFVWRADPREAYWQDTRVLVPKTGQKEPCNDKVGDCDWTAASFEELKKLISEQAPEGYLRRNATLRIEKKLAPNRALEGENEMARVWAIRASSSRTPEIYERSAAEQWRKAGCAAEGAPYVLQALLARFDDRFSMLHVLLVGLSPFGADSPEVPKLAAAFLDKDCPGARGLTEAEIAKLKAIRDRAPPPAAKKP